MTARASSASSPSSPGARPSALSPAGASSAGARVGALNRVLELVVLLSEDMRQDLDRIGLTPARAQALWVLAERGPSTQRTLAEALGVTARNVTGLVDALVENGFVTREAHPTDRRAVLVSFTDRGASTVARMRDQHAELAELLFGTMPARRFAEFSQGLDDILATIHRELERQKTR